MANEQGREKQFTPEELEHVAFLVENGDGVSSASDDAAKAIRQLIASLAAAEGERDRAVKVITELRGYADYCVGYYTPGGLKVSSNPKLQMSSAIWLRREMDGYLEFIKDGPAWPPPGDKSDAGGELS